MVKLTEEDLLHHPKLNSPLSLQVLDHLNANNQNKKGVPNRKLLNLKLMTRRRILKLKNYLKKGVTRY